MKLSVILGITHMTLGIFLKGLNAIYFKSALDFLCEFLPQLIFFLCLFGYMFVLIIMKWLINWTDVLEAQGTAGKVPQIIATFSQIYTNPADTATNGSLPIIGYTSYAELSQNPSSLQYNIQLGL
jgi:V-type H+-transporting ATPase subunit a